MKGVQIWLAVALFGAMGLVGCKTTSSGSAAKALPLQQIDQLTLEQWVTACEKEKADPALRAQAIADLKIMAGTDSCADAYLPLKAALAKIVSDYSPR